MPGRLFTSESVSMGHPDKLSDQISDSVLDAFLDRDPKGVKLAVVGHLGPILAVDPSAAR